MNATRTATGEPPATGEGWGATANTMTGTSEVVEESRDRASAERRGHRKKLLTGLALTVTVCLTAWFGGRWWMHARAWTSTDNAYLAAHVHSISARVSGTVQEVFVQENQEVPAGALLAKLDPRDFEAKRAKAQAQLEQAQAEVEQARAQRLQAGAAVAREKARAKKATLDFERAKALFEGKTGTISKQEFDQSQAEAEAARAALEGAECAIRSAEAQVAAAKALEQVALANLQEADLQLSYTKITTPVAGRAGRKNLEIGNRVEPGQPLVALVQEDLWVTANFKETQLVSMKPGQAVRVSIDAFPGRTFTGHVESLSPASGAQFALLPPDNASGNFTRIVQRVPVKIVLNRAELKEAGARIVPGMSAIVKVHTAKETER